MYIKLFTLATVLCLMGIVESADAMPIIMDQCNQTSGDGQGHSCPGANDLLIRFKYADGTCGDWICCPPNPDGKTYDCAHATNPTSVTGPKLKGAIFQDRNLTLNPATGQTTVRHPGIPGGPKGGVMQRGVEGEQPAEPSTPTAPKQPTK
jgi:hypothetical protein